MNLIWVSIAASVCMGSSAALLFLFAVKKEWVRDVEDAKYQVFWSDLEELVNQSTENRNSTESTARQ